MKLPKLNKLPRPHERREIVQVHTTTYDGPDRRKRAKGSKGRRATDRGQLLRDLVLAVVCLLVFLALSKQHTQTKVIQEGRQTGSAVTCAIASAFGQAGKSVISGPAKPPPKAQEAALEQLGFPPFAVRRRAQVKAGNAYVTSISTRIDAQIGHKGDGLVNADGTINCVRLATLSHVKPAHK